MRLPLYVRGPRVPPNETRAHPTTHVDLAATIVDLTPTGPPLDGLSFAAALTRAPIAPADWRNYSYSEYYDANDTWVMMRFPHGVGEFAAGAAQGGAGASTEPHARGAAGAADASALKLAYWCTDEVEVFNMTADVWELSNLHATPRGAAVARATLPYLATLANCAGAACRRPLPAPPSAPIRACYNITGPFDAYDP